MNFACIFGQRESILQRLLETSPSITVFFCLAALVPKVFSGHVLFITPVTKEHGLLLFLGII